MEKFKLDGIEQPVAREDVRGMAFVRQHIGTPLMVDEGVLTSTDAMRLIEADAMDVVCIKLWKVGGFMKAREIASLCRSNNIGCHIGSTPGSQLLEAGQLQFAASTPDLAMGAEIGEFDEFTEDPASGLEIKGGALQVSDAPGLGVEVDLSKARELTM
jgi:L-alanine-DL-glutamate epimerase-like enolase superfamily enzyme